MFTFSVVLLTIGAGMLTVNYPLLKGATANACLRPSRSLVAEVLVGTSCAIVGSILMIRYW